MERETLITAMKSSISEVMETMFFLPVEFPNLEELQSSDKADQIIVSKLNFSGSFSGYFILSVPGKLALSLTSDFIGEDENNISGEQKSETMKEILNMLAGGAFTHYDDSALFNLDIPETVNFGKAETDDSGLEEKIIVIIQTPDDCLSLAMYKQPG